MKISEVLHKAADEHLASNYDNFNSSWKTERFSCCAVGAAAGFDSEVESRILKGLEEMGCPTSSTTAFSHLGYDDILDSETQGVRYMWLKFAALMAEEQGV